MDNFDRAKEYFKKLKLVEEFVDGNTKIAKMILDGTIKDIIVIKGRFKSNIDRFKSEENDWFGLFTIYINKLHPEVLKTSNIVCRLPSLYRYKPMVPFFDFQHSIEVELAHDSHDREKVKFFENVLDRFVSGQSINDIITWVDKNLIVDITDFFNKIVADMLDIEEPTILLDFENVSSADLFEKSGMDVNSFHRGRIKNDNDDNQKDNVKEENNDIELKWS